MGGGQVKILEEQRIPEALALDGGKATVSRVMRTQRGMLMVVRPWPWMAQVKTTAKAGANWLSAVPPMVWSALRLMAAKARSSEEDHAAQAGHQDGDEHGQLGVRRAEAVLVKGLQR